MKIISWIVLCCFCLNVFAGSVDQLERAVDRYQYAVTVEWDQKDMRFLHEQSDAFYENLGKMLAAKEISASDVSAVLERRIEDKQLLAAIQAKLALTDKVRSPDELVSVLKDHSSELYAKGASWNGQVMTPVLTLVVLAAILALIVYSDLHHECVQAETQNVCRTREGEPYCADQAVCVKYSDDPK